MSYIIQINEQQMNLIEKALKLLQHKEGLDPTMEGNDTEELSIMVDMIGPTRIQEAENPDTIHGWCL